VYQYVHNGVRQGGVLSPFLFRFHIRYAGTHQFTRLCRRHGCTRTILACIGICHLFQLFLKLLLAKLACQAFILSRLDYCNALLAGLPRATTVQRVQNAAARLVLNLRLRDHVTPALKQLHWFPVASRIRFKLYLLMHLIHTGRAPQYLVDSVQ